VDETAYWTQLINNQQECHKQRKNKKGDKKPLRGKDKVSANKYFDGFNDYWTPFRLRRKLRKSTNGFSLTVMKIKGSTFTRIAFISIATNIA
jgi:hypothetical protein